MREKLIELIRTVYVSIPPRLYKAVVDDTAAAVIADHLIENGVTVQEWISVEDRLPENFSTVLVYEPDVGVGMADYEHHRFEWVENEKLAFATHWMPLPEPPKGD